MANFCGKCGRKMSEMERENMFSLNGYGTVCRDCYTRAASVRGNGVIKGNIWTTYFKAALYLMWIVFTLAGLFIGSAEGILGAILMGGIFFIAGFVVIANAMISITMAEDIAIIRKNITDING